MCNVFINVVCNACIIVGIWCLIKIIFNIYAGLFGQVRIDRQTTGVSKLNDDVCEALFSYQEQFSLDCQSMSGGVPSCSQKSHWDPVG